MQKRIALLILLLAATGSAQTRETVAKLAEKIDRMAAREPLLLAVDVRMQTADALRTGEPELAKRMRDAALREASAADPWAAFQMVLMMAGMRSPDAAAAVRQLPVRPDTPEYQQAVDALRKGIDGSSDEMKMAQKLARPSGGTAMSSPPDPAVQKLAPRLKELRGDLSKADRAKLAETFATDIRAIENPQNRLGLAAALSNYATEGDLGHAALQAVTETLGLAIRDIRPNVDGRLYLDLAKLVRYEHMKSPIEDPSLDSRMELLHLRELVAEQTEFTLTGIDGKTYALQGLRGHVVVVNFWATWCPPCRREMPDLEELSKRYREQGLIVLAISEETPDKVKPFIEKQGYTFPVLLDQDRRVNTAFHVEGIPKTYIFDRQGKLVAHAIDMRTKDQFLDLLKRAGLK